MTKEQQHPQYNSDRKVVDTLLTGEQNDYNLVEAARLFIRYRDFPGANDIKTDLEKTLNRWKIDEETLYQATRKIHAKGIVYKTRNADSEDWA